MGDCMIFRKTVLNLEDQSYLGLSNFILYSLIGFCQGSADWGAYLELDNNLNIVVTEIFWCVSKANKQGSTNLIYIFSITKEVRMVYNSFLFLISRSWEWRLKFRNACYTHSPVINSDFPPPILTHLHQKALQRAKWNILLRIKITNKSQMINLNQSLWEQKRTKCEGRGQVRREKLVGAARNSSLQGLESPWNTDQGRSWTAQPCSALVLEFMGFFVLV